MRPKGRGPTSALVGLLLPALGAEVRGWPSSPTDARIECARAPGGAPPRRTPRRAGALAAPLLALLGCSGHRPPDSRLDSRDTAREAIEGTAWFPLVGGWTWTYNAADGGTEHRATAGPGSFAGLATWQVKEWQSGDRSSSYDESTVYFTADAAGVSIVGSQHADSSIAGATDTVTYEPPLLYVPADPAASPTFSTEGAVHLVVTDDSGVLQDSTIPWSMAGACAPQAFVTPAGTFDGYAITYTPGGKLGYAEGVGLVDMGSGRLLEGWEGPGG